MQGTEDVGVRVGSHQLGTHGWLRLLVAAALVLVLVLALEASPAAGASSKACRVKNTDTGRTFTTLQTAVKAAKPGAHLIVKGTCIGSTVISKRLVVEGVRTERLGKPKLSGAGSTRVIKVEVGTRVRMRAVEIVRGKGGEGGGILNRGTLILRDSLVRSCEVGIQGSVVYNDGRLTLRGSTRISRNPERGTDWWDALTTVLVNDGTITLNDTSSISGNRALPASNYGTITLNDASSIRGNRGAVQNWGPAGTITLNDASRISGNEQGGVENSLALVMNDTSSISGNGGYGVQNYGTLTLNDSTAIAGNEGGVWNFGTLVMNGSATITGNTEAGVYVGDGALTGVICAPEAGANVYGNTPDDCVVEP